MVEYHAVGSTFHQAISPTEISGDTLRGVEIGRTGDRLYVASETDGVIYQYDLTADSYDISTASYSGNSVTQDCVGIGFDDVGSTAYFVDNSPAEVVAYDLSPSWELSGAAQFNTYDLRPDMTDDTPRGFDWNNDGSAWYVAEATTAKIYQYATSDYGLTGADLDKTTTLSVDTPIDGLVWNHDGTKLFVIGNDIGPGTDGGIREFTAGTAFDVTTLSDNGAYSAGTQRPTDVDVGDSPNSESPNGWQFYITENDDNQVESHYAAVENQTPVSTLTAIPPEPKPSTDIITPVTTLTTVVPEPNIGFDKWVVNKYPIGINQSETATDQTISLSQRVTQTELANAARPLKSDEGKVDVLALDDGGFQAVGRASGANEYRLIPPVRRLDLRKDQTVYVDRYEEDVVSQEVKEWNVEVDFIVNQDRTDTPSISQSPASNEWGFTTRFGTIATARVDADVLGTGRDGVRRYELTTRLTFDQAHVWEAAYARIRGSRVKSIPDASNVMVDETGGDATVTVDAPDGQDAISDGDYVVTEWSSERVTDAYQELTVTLAET